MSVEIKRCCNSSILRKEDSFTFNSWKIRLDGRAKLMYIQIVNHLLNTPFWDPDTPDVEAKILEHILTIGLIRMTNDYEEADE